MADAPTVAQLCLTMPCSIYARAMAALFSAPMTRAAEAEPASQWSNSDS